MPGVHRVGTSGNDTLNGTDGEDTLEGLGGNDSLVGGLGADVFIGGEGNDTLNGESSAFAETDPHVETMDGGLGNDLYIVDNDADVLLDAGGIDTVRAKETSWTLGSGFENLVLDNEESENGRVGIGNELDNNMTVLWGGRLEGRGGDDTLRGSSVGDALMGGDGNDLLTGGTADSGFDRLDGGNGNDTLDGQGFGVLTGGAGADSFVFGPDTSGEPITDFSSGSDTIRLDAATRPALGASGDFTAGDARFFSGAGATSGQDTSDRVIYNTTTGDLWYDADGSGSGTSVLIATLQGTPALVATDIEVINGRAVGGQVINGTAGNDTLSGTAGNDTINGLGGNDLFLAGSTRRRRRDRRRHGLRLD